MTDPEAQPDSPLDEDAGEQTPARWLDGNAAAGPLRELFAVDLTAAVCTCGHCGNAAPIAGYTLYVDAPALVLRCPGCSSVVLRYASTGGRLRLDLSGTQLLTLDPAAAP